MNESSLGKLIQFLSLEENKGSDYFRMNCFIMFKGLFRNFGDSFIPMFKPHLEKLVDEADEESSQRCAAEIVTGIVRGSKHWTYSMVQDLWTWLAPLIEKVRNQLNEYSLIDWASCFVQCCYKRDPNRYMQHSTG